MFSIVLLINLLSFTGRCECNPSKYILVKLDDEISSKSEDRNTIQQTSKFRFKPASHDEKALMKDNFALNADYGEVSRRSSDEDDQRIVGGKSASKGQFPYQVSIVCGGTQHNCGGIIYSNRTIITAGHCCFSIKQGVCTDPILHIGTNKQNIELGQKRSAKKYLIHPKFYRPDYLNDVCLIYADEPFDLDGKYSAAIPLGDPKSCSVGTNCIISGFGKLWHNGPLPNRLMYAEIPIINDGLCHPFKNFYSDQMTCAGHLKGGVDSCQADSGGPMQCNGKLCGIVSYGLDCAKEGFPGVYTKIPNYANWIRENSL